MIRSRSSELYQRACASIPGGVNSPVRAFRSVGGHPVFISRGEGAYLIDADDNKYIDYINSWGPMILGHAYEPVVDAIRQSTLKSTSFGAPTLAEIEIAELIKSMVPNVDMIRMVNSGTEACMSAIRLARGYTGRNKFIKFEGCYHGHADCFLVNAGSGLATFGIQTVPGVTAGVTSDTISAAFNDLDQVRSIVKRNHGELATIIVEPVPGNMGCIVPEAGFLQGLRELCDQYGILLIFDEVMTGFRLAPGGAQERLGVEADLLTFGKVIGGGLPVGAFGGRSHIMKHIAPLGNVYQAGTLSGNPLAMAAGYATLSELHNNPGIYLEIERKAGVLADGLDSIFRLAGLPFVINHMGSMLSIHFSDQPVRDFTTAAAARNDLFSAFFHAMLDRGVYLPPSAFETWFISNALSDSDINTTLSVARESLKEVEKIL